MRKLAWWCAGFSSAIFLSCYLLPQGLWLPAALGSLLLLAAVFLLLRGDTRILLSLVCAGLAVGFLWNWGWMEAVLGRARELDRQTVRLDARVWEYPVQTDHGWSVVVRTGEGLKTLLYLEEEGRRMRPGDRMESVVHLTLADRTKAGEEITYYTAKGIFLRGTCYGELKIEPRERLSPIHWPAELSHLLKAGIDRSVEEPWTGFVRAVVTGNRDKLSDPFTSDLQRTGLSHVVAVSGMHLVCFGELLALFFGRRRKITAILVIGWSVFFSLVAGSTPSVTRAAVMLTLLYIAPLFACERDGPTALSLAMALLLGWNPCSAAHVGLQLSFGAVAGIFCVSEPLEHMLLRRLPYGKYHGWKALPYALLRGGWRVVGTSVGAMLFTLPLCAIHFGTASLVAPVANLLTLWAITGLFALGLLCGLLGIICLPLARLVALPVQVLAAWVRGVSEVLGELPYASLTMDTFYARAWMGWFCLLVLLTTLMGGRKKPAIPLCCLALSLVWVITLTAADYGRGTVSVTALDVGQGQSVVLRSGDHISLVDCGGDSYEDPGDVAADYLAGRGCTRIDLLVLTHFHADHANGVVRLLERMEVGTLAVPDIQPDSLYREEILTYAEQVGTRLLWIRGDARLETEGGYSLTLFAPLGSFLDPNEQGLGVLAGTPEHQILITGDMSGKVEELLLDYTRLPQLDVLVAGHHGAEDSTTDALLRETRPRITLISVGRQNLYGHPDQQVLDRLKNRGSEIYRTDLDGTVTVTLGDG